MFQLSLHQLAELDEKITKLTSTGSSSVNTFLDPCSNSISNAMAPNCSSSITRVPASHNSISTTFIYNSNSKINADFHELEEHADAGHPDDIPPATRLLFASQKLWN